VAQRVGRGIVLLFHDLGTRREWVVSSTPRLHFTLGENPVPSVQEAEWAPGPVWTGAENLAPTGILAPGHPARSQSLYRLSYPAHTDSVLNTNHPNIHTNVYLYMNLKSNSQETITLRFITVACLRVWHTRSCKSTLTRNQKCMWILLKRTHTRRNNKRRWRTWTCEICSRLSRHPNHMGVPINSASPYEHTGVLLKAQQNKKTAVTTSCFWPRFTGIFLFTYYLPSSALIFRRHYELHTNYTATVISYEQQTVERQCWS
jgi:hypothetical protein